MATEAEDYTQPVLPGRGGSDYERYLRTDELLELQKEPDERAHHDELLFQTVHQSSELWLKLAWNDAEEAARLVEEGDLRGALRLLKRSSLCIRFVVSQLQMLEQMSPWEYQEIRKVLGHGSGFDSPGWVELRRVLPRLGQAFHARRREAGLSVAELYVRGREHEGLYQLAEALIELDEQAQLWRMRHYQVVARVIGDQVVGIFHGLVVDGQSLADAMARSPETFPRVYVAMVQAGETGGFLDLVLAQIADFQGREKELRSKVLTALLYPTILLVLASSVLVFLLVFFIPRFQSVFAGFGGKLPLLTQLIVWISDALRSYGLLIGLGLGIGAYLTRSWLRSEQGRRTWEGLILRMPVIGNLVAQFAMSRFCRMLGTLLGAGVPLINGLNVARRSIGNQILVDAVSNSIDRVKEGKALGVSLAECRALFPGSVLEMVAVAEESGKLDQELVRIATVTEGDLDRQLKVLKRKL